MGDQVPHPYKTTDKIIVLNVLVPCIWLLVNNMLTLDNLKKKGTIYFNKWCRIQSYMQLERGFNSLTLGRWR
jgi:hypothetical protein